jgi:hypothetical protein
MSTLPEIFLFPLSSFSFVRNGRGERGKRKIPAELTSLPVAPLPTASGHFLLRLELWHHGKTEVSEQV